MLRCPLGMPDDAKPFHNPFAALAGMTGKGGQPAATPPPSTTPTTTRASDTAKPAAGGGPARAVVRLERSGRGGKEVTVIEQLGLSTAQREAWLKQLKAALGCGGSVEGDALVLQGDHRRRAPAWLTARGVRRVTLG
jgi:translation initiation factor 1